MTTKELAKEMVNKFFQPLGYLSCQTSSGKMWEYAKSSAIIMCDEAIYASTQCELPSEDTFNYYTSLKTEINNL